MTLVRSTTLDRPALAVVITLTLVACSQIEQSEISSNPSPIPDRIVLTWTGDPATSQSVTWRTDETIEQAYVEFAPAVPASNLMNNSKRVAATTQSLDLHVAGLNESFDPNVSYHTAEMADLRPDTLYAYRVGDSARWSEWFQFRTAASDRSPFSFIYMGDVQDGILSHWARTIRAAVSTAPDARFIVYAGDLVNEGHFDAEWNEWFEASGWIHAGVNVVPATGNHEYRPLQDRGTADDLALQWRPQFSLPTDSEIASELHETVYWIEYQGARVYVLNSNVYLDEQAEWLRHELEASDVTWNIAVFHHPVFPSRDAVDRGAIRAAWLSVFEDYGVDLVLQGHDHNYARGHTAGGTENEASTVYVTSVAGAKMYTFRPDGWESYAEYGLTLDRAAENTQLFSVISVAPDVLSFQAYTVTGELYDAFELHHSNSGSTLLVEGEIGDVTTRTFENTVPYEDRWTRRAQRNLTQ